MYLKRITVTGFKSFANKTVLDLEPGITAVVGPNGSGKSNLAEAIRWALGEQSKGRLRTKERDEVVFAGTEKRARASYAEVVLLFDNEDGALPLELTEVEVSRRLYRSGETDYRLAGRSVRLGDITQLLAEGGFGVNSYAVIGQGMIDSFLLSSPTERKLLFDEAAGIRGAELKREAAVRKLAATEANLIRLRDIAAELEPRLASLQRAAVAHEEEQELAAKLAGVRSALVALAGRELSQQAEQLATDRAALTAELHHLRHDAGRLERQQAQRLQAAAADQERHNRLQQQLRAAEADYTGHLEAVATLRGRQEQLARSLERLPELRRRCDQVTQELAAAQDRLAEITEELAGNVAAGERAARAVGRADDNVTRVQADLVAIRQSTADGTQQQYVTHALEILKTIAQGLNNDSASPEQLRLLVHKAGRLLSHAAKTSEAELLTKLRDTQQRLESAMGRRDTATEHQTNITITCRSLEIDQLHQQAAVTRLQERLSDAEADYDRIQARQAELTAVAADTQAAEQQLAQLRAAVDACRHDIEVGAQAADTAEVAAAATQLERLRSQQGAAELRWAQVRQALAAVAAEQRRYVQLARQWNVTAAPETRAKASLAELEQTQERLEIELATRRRLSQANAAEYAEVDARAAELATQITDLDQAQGDLGRVVTELDGLIRARFKENFAKLSDHFAQAFTRLFGGGSAALELEEQDEGRYGILIKVSPKGKRLTNLSALSGGERAMAGVALLTAILNVNPSPFVVLDEIDAALDEANSGRLGDILEELSTKSQLIVITHNRQTMKAAKVLFGVTMNEHHISHLLSLRLEEASALAAR